MPRKVTASLQRRLSPDRKYQSVMVQRLINTSMLDRKKRLAERAVYEALEMAAKKLDSENPLEVFERALKNVSPNFEVKSRRVGGANYQVPVPVSNERRQILALRWIRDICRKKKGKGMAEKLAEEIVLAANREGAAMKKRDDTHRMAEANKAFAHFA